MLHLHACNNYRILLCMNIFHKVCHLKPGISKHKLDTVCFLLMLTIKMFFLIHGDVFYSDLFHKPLLEQLITINLMLQKTLFGPLANLLPMTKYLLIFSWPAEGNLDKSRVHTLTFSWMISSISIWFSYSISLYAGFVLSPLSCEQLEVAWWSVIFIKYLSRIHLQLLIIFW